MAKNNKRNHRKVVARRKTRQKNAAISAKLQSEKELFDFYSEGHNILPMPTLVDALSNQKDEGQYSEIEKNILDCFEKDIEKISKENHVSDQYIPDNVISFIIPLDFHIPLNSPYNAVSISLDKTLINEVCCTTVVSEVLPVGTAPIKISYLVVSICKDSASLAFKKKVSSEMLSVYEEAIRICNDMIASFQATSFRHNHYFHPITVLSAPSVVKYFIFNRKTKKILSRNNFNVHGNIYSEVFSSFPNTDEELALFRSAHVNKTFSNDKIFKLVSKIQEAVNLRCLGFYNESIIASDNFVEMSLGYLYCEIRIALGGERDTIYKDFSKIETMSELWQELKDLLSYPSVTKLKNDINFNDWSKYCRKRRDNLTHRFLTEDYNGVESLEAAYYSSGLIRKLCSIINSKIKVSDYPLSDKLEFLSRATLFAKNLYENGEKHGSPKTAI